MVLKDVTRDTPGSPYKAKQHPVDVSALQGQCVVKKEAGHKLSLFLSLFLHCFITFYSYIIVINSHILKSELYFGFVYFCDSLGPDE